ncbi:MAG: HIT domain-containing protein [Verrucomicrobia bacterium]|nr:HIT domain-containing protein [Verrucomicrobiota bacterium]
MSLIGRFPLASTESSLIHRAYSSPSPYDLIRLAIQSLRNNQDKPANASVAELLNQYPGIAKQIFFLTWEAAGRPTPLTQPEIAHPEFGKLAFFGEEGRSISRELKLEILFRVEKASCSLCSTEMIDSQLVYTDGRYWNVLCPLTPATNGHLLIVPLRHADKFDQLTAEEAAELVKVIQKCAKVFLHLYQADDYQTASKNAGPSDRSLPHFHLHLTPTPPESAENVEELGFGMGHSLPIRKMRSAFEVVVHNPSELACIEKLLTSQSATEVDHHLLRVGLKWRLETLFHRMPDEQQKEQIRGLLTQLEGARVATKCDYYANLKEIDHHFAPFLLPFSRGRDRHPPCMPYRFNQVFSAGIAMNGSYIKFPEEGQSYHLAPTYCIAMSAPMPTYIPHTLGMYMQENVKIVINLTAFEEGEFVKAHRYLPSASKETVRHEDYSITSTEISHTSLPDSWMLEQNKCLLQLEDKEHEIISYHVQGWKDFTPGSIPAIVAVIKIIVDYEKHFGKGVIAVHCSGGVGRTGVFIAGKKVYERLLQGEEPDIRQIAASMRMQRKYLGGSEEQYKVVWELYEEFKRQIASAL